MRNKFSFIFSVLIMCLSLSSCSAPYGEKPSGTNIPEATTTPLIENETVFYTSDAEFEVPISEENARFFGRTYSTKSQSQDRTTYYFNWTNSGFEVAFEGTKLEAEFHSIKALDEVRRPYVLVFIDGKEEPEDAITIEINETRGYYTLAENLSEGKHVVKVVKRTECAESPLGVSKLRLPADSKLYVAQQSKNTRKIEYIGDSITCGFGNLSSNPNGNFETKTEDGWQTYAAITARSLNADANYITLSGWAMHVSPYGDASVPKIYDYIDGVNNKRNTDAAKWDFSKFQPDVVVINLGTNDNGYVGNNTERLENFKQAYLDFLKRLRGYYPNAHIVCTMGMMTGTEIKLMDYLHRACEEFADSNCSILEFPMQNIAEDGAGCGHPSIKTHEKCAVLLTDHIKDKLNWQ